MSETLRATRYERIVEQLADLVRATSDPVAHRSTAAALLHHKVPRVSWTGFYMLRGGELTVDAYQGQVACLVLSRHTGVCWAALDRDETLVVGDVHAFPGHIACDGRSRAELVVPLHDRDGRPIGVLDVDSHDLDRFDEVDEAGYESVARLLEAVWNGP
jgi:GAF domain-containing protein